MTATGAAVAKAHSAGPRRVLVAVLGVGISLVALTFVALTIDIEQTAATLGSASPLPLLGVLGAVGVQALIRAIRWQALLRASLATSDVPLGPVARAMLVGYLANVVLPSRLGELVRTALLARRLERPVEPVLGTVVVERVVDVGSLAVVGVLAAVITLGPGSPLVLTGLLVAAGAIVVVGGLLLGARALGGRAAGAASGDGWRARVAAILGRFVAGLSRLPPRVIALAALISFAAWGLDGLSFWLVSASLGLEVTYAGALVLASVTVLGTALPSAPGFVGTFEVATVTAGVALGMSAESALAVAILAHVVLVGALAVVGAASLAFEGAVGRRAIASARSS